MLAPADTSAMTITGYPDGAVVITWPCGLTLRVTCGMAPNLALWGIDGRVGWEAVVGQA